jgi:hyperosmotically inducible protein
MLNKPFAVAVVALSATLALAACSPEGTEENSQSSVIEQPSTQPDTTEQTAQTAPATEAVPAPATDMAATQPAPAVTDATSATAEPDDASITAEVMVSVDNATAEPRSINVDTQDGVVTVTGEVKTEEEKDRIVEVINTIQGVRSVNAQGLVVNDQA